MQGKKPGLATSQEHAAAQDRLTPWQEFYQQVRDPSWPDCDLESEFHDLPQYIQQEITHIHGYRPGEYHSRGPLRQRRFPIVSDTACQLKWTWSTVYLSTAMTASCHRTNHHRFDTSSFDFHNTPEKLEDRARMLQGEWPAKGCDYCRDIELSGGCSDRITNLDLEGVHAPPELDHDPNAVSVTPRILEVYFDNTCNLKCVYCGPYFSSLWDAENKKHGAFRSNGLEIRDDFSKDTGYEHNKSKLFAWLKQHRQTLTDFNILGGEPLFQLEFDECLQFFHEHAAPDLGLQIFTNLNVKLDRLVRAVDNIRQLIDQSHLRKFSITASLDCWGPRQEYARFPLDLARWQENFEYLVQQDWINLVVGSTITPLTVRTLPDLIERINAWNRTRPVHHYFNSVNNPSYMKIDILGDLFRCDLERAIELTPNTTPHQQQVRRYLQGICQESQSRGVNTAEVIKLRTFLDEMDRRRGTNWIKTFPELVSALGAVVDQ